MSIPGTISTLDLANGEIVNMDEAIYVYSPMELPLLTGVGADGRSVLSSGPVDQTEFSWLDEETLAPRSTLSASLTTTGTTLTLADNTERLRFHTGDVLMVGGGGTTERLVIASYGSTAGTLVLAARGTIGTAQVFTSGDAVVGVGMMAGEGATPVDVGARDTSTRYNVTQIFGPVKLSMTDTDRVIPRYGIPDQWARHLYHRTYELNQAREQALVYGLRYSTSANTQRAMGGLFQYVTTKVSTATTLNVAAITAAQQGNYNEGGVPDALWCNPVSLADLNSADSSLVRTDFVDTRRGRFPVTTVITEFGPATIVRNRWLEPKDAALVRRDQLRRRVLRPMSFQFLAKTADATDAMLVCEESLEVKGEKHMTVFNALSYTR